MTHWLRVAIFFVYMFGFVIALPWLVGFVVQRVYGNLNVPPVTASNWAVKDGQFFNAGRLLGSNGQPTVSMGVQFPSAQAVSLLTSHDGTMSVALQADSSAHLEQAAQRVARQLGLDLATDRDEQRSHTESSYYTHMRRTATRMLLVAGMDATAVDSRMVDMPGLGDGPNGDFRVAPPRIRHAAVWAVFLWAGLQFFIFGRIASWAAVQMATPGVAPVSATELGNRLMALNQLDVPWAVTRGKQPNEYLIDWRYADTKWLGQARLHGMSSTYRLVLRLDAAAHNARAQDREASFDWSAGAGGASLNWHAVYGITFAEYRYERSYGLHFQDGKPLMTRMYEYTFNLQALKDPIMQVVRDSGWNYRPVITFFRPIGG